MKKELRSGKMNDEHTQTPRLSWWQLALVSVAVSFLGRLSAGRNKNKEQQIYSRELKQANWAPPAWLFAPAWTVNNSFMLSALQRLLKLPNGNKKSLLWLQAGIWAIFFSFNYVYFRKKSPVLAAIWTKIDTGLALSSLILAWKADRKLAYKYIPLLAWTLFAGTVADYQALHNRDKVFKIDPVLN
jgi:tryptophan-rich sensory protein